jgi:peptidoglycan L-alanyl-D-glutamate endopeptidase CwlK
MQPRFTIAPVLACLALAGCSIIQPKPKPGSPWIYQTPKPHGAIYRFFHPKNERMWKGVSPALREGGSRPGPAGRGRIRCAAT